MISSTANITNSRAAQNFHFILCSRFTVLAFINEWGVLVVHSKCDGMTCVREARRGPRYIKSEHATYRGYVIYENTENFAARSRKTESRQPHRSNAENYKAKIASLATKITVGKCYFYWQSVSCICNWDPFVYFAKTLDRICQIKLKYTKYVKLWNTETAVSSAIYKCYYNIIIILIIIIYEKFYRLKREI